MILGRSATRFRRLSCSPCYLALPVIGILGRAGVLYFAVSFAIMAAALSVFLVLSRRLARGRVPAGRRRGCRSAARVERGLAQGAAPGLELSRPAAAADRAVLPVDLVCDPHGWLNFTAPKNFEAFLSPAALTVIGSRVGGCSPRPAPPLNC